MDTSPIVAPETGGVVKLASILRCIDGDTKLPITAAVAVTRHIAALGLLVFALLALAIVYCFTSTWLLLLWFQAQLLIFTAQLLDSTVGEQMLTQQKFSTSEKEVVDVLEDIPPQNITPEQQHITSDSQTATKESQACREQDVKVDSGEPLPNTSTQLRCPELPVNDNNEDTPGTPPPAEQRTKSDQQPTAPSSWLDREDFANLEANVHSGLDFQSSRHVPATVQPSPEETKRLDQARRSSEQSSFVSMMLNRPNGTPQGLPSNGTPFAGIDTTNDSPRSNPFNVTPENLAEARSFSRVVSQGTKKAREAAQVQLSRSCVSSKPVVFRKATARATVPVHRPPQPKGWIPPHKRKTLRAVASTSGIGEQSISSDAAFVKKGEEATSAAIETKSTVHLSVESVNDLEAVSEQHNTTSATNEEPDADWTRPPGQKFATEGELAAASDDTSHVPSLPAVRGAVSATAGIHDECSHSISSLGDKIEPLEEVQYEGPVQKASWQSPTPNEALKALNTEIAADDGLWERIQTARHTILCPDDLCNISNCKHTWRNARPSGRDSCLERKKTRSEAIEEVAYVVPSRLAQDAPLIDLEPPIVGHHTCGPNGLTEGTMQPSILDVSDPGVGLPQTMSVDHKRSSGVDHREANAVFQAVTETMRRRPSPRALVLSMPPGLGHAVPAHQAAFDALVPNPKLVTTATEHDIVGPGIRGPDLSTPDTFGHGATFSSEGHSSAGSQDMPFDGTVGQPESQPESSSNDLKLDNSHPSAVQAVGWLGAEMSVVKSGREDGIADVVNSAFPPYVEEPKTEDTITTSKRVAREMRKEARGLLKRAWLDREKARAKLSGTFSLDDAQILVHATRSYMFRRARLTELMPEGALNEEDAKVYPPFHESALEKPKYRPEGLQNLQNVEATHDKAAAAPLAPAVDETALDKAKTSIAAARKLHIQAREYFKNPDHTVQYAVWKAKGDNKLERATAYYTKKREALVKAYGSAGLPKEMSDLYPPVQ